MLIERALLDDVIAHARAEYGAECCGLIAYDEGDEGHGRAVLAAAGAAASDRGPSTGLQAL